MDQSFKKKDISNPLLCLLKVNVGAREAELRGGRGNWKTNTFKTSLERKNNSIFIKNKPLKTFLTWDWLGLRFSLIITVLLEFEDSKVL